MPSPFSAIEEVPKNIDVPERYKSFQRDVVEPKSYVTFALGIISPVMLTLPGSDKFPVLGKKVKPELPVSVPLLS